jgi:hypothetical protein
MEREISGGAMLGIVLLALAAVIGLGFGVFTIAKSIANEGTVNVQGSITTVGSQMFLDYDQKIITGLQVVSGLKMFDGKPYAILIATKSLQTGALTESTHIAYAVQDADSKPQFLNYNAILADTGGGADWVTGKIAKGTAVTDSQAKDILDLINGSYEAKLGLASKDGVIIFDKQTSGIFKAGNVEFITNTSKYQSNLIKNLSGDVIGIALEQL